MNEGFTADDVINHLRALKLSYIRNKMWLDPAQLPNHLGEFLGYATLLYDHYSEYIKKYELAETKIIQEENKRRLSLNAEAESHSDKISVTEVQQRIDVRIGNLKAEKKRLEVATRGATIHINGCQSLLKNWSDESKGIR